MSQLQTVLGLGAMAILFIPVIGVLLSPAIGSPRLPADRRRKQWLGSVVA